MVAKNGALDSLLELPESLKKRYLEQASRCSLKFLYDALGITTACEAGYKQAVNPRLHIEFALMKLSFLMKAPQPAGERIETPVLRQAQEPVLRQAQEPVEQPRSSEPARTPRKIGP